jgi:hypothetical protein
LAAFYLWSLPHPGPLVGSRLIHSLLPKEEGVGGGAERTHKGSEQHGVIHIDTDWAREAA